MTVPGPGDALDVAAVRAHVASSRHASCRRRTGSSPCGEAVARVAVAEASLKVS